jgi:hypothetical protein
VPQQQPGVGAIGEWQRIRRCLRDRHVEVGDRSRRITAAVACGATFRPHVGIVRMMFDQLVVVGFGSVEAARDQVHFGALPAGVEAIRRALEHVIEQPQGLAVALEAAQHCDEPAQQRRSGASAMARRRSSATPAASPSARARRRLTGPAHRCAHPRDRIEVGPPGRSPEAKPGDAAQQLHRRRIDASGERQVGVASPGRAVGVGRAQPRQK